MEMIYSMPADTRLLQEYEATESLRRLLAHSIHPSFIVVPLSDKNSNTEN
jgi:hypothetical protein